MYKITILGDVMFQKEMLNYDFEQIFFNVKEYLKKSDLVIANLETPVANEVSDKDIKKYQFLAPKFYVEILKKIGINMVSTANNHCLDNGKDGLFKTIEILDELGIEHIGTYKTKNEPRYLIKEIENKKIAFLANTYGTNAFENKVYIDKKDKFHICMLQEQELHNKYVRRFELENKGIINLIKRIFRKLHILQMNIPVYERKEKSYLVSINNDIKKIKEKENPDYIIMMMHDGGQNNDEPIKRTYKRIKNMEKMGINAIITNHEHMIHKVCLKEDKKGIITYSLGNFISVQGVLDEPFDKMQDYSIGINIYFDNSGIKYTFTIFKIFYDKNQKIIRVDNLYNLINKETDIDKKKELIEDNKKIVNKVLSNNDEIDIKLEYNIERE